jgi:hypothetical protein
MHSGITSLRNAMGYRQPVPEPHVLHPMSNPAGHRSDLRHMASTKPTEDLAGVTAWLTGAH